MDTIFIRDLEIETIIGIYDHERNNPQKVVFDIDMQFDTAKAAASEDIEDALNYKSICDQLSEYVGQSSFQLIETLAEKVADLIIADYGVEQVRVGLQKPDALPGKTNVGVIIERRAPTAK